MNIKKHALVLGTALWALSGSGAEAAVAQTVKLLMASAKVDLASDTVTLPLHEGKLKDGRAVWFILTDASDAKVALKMGLVYAPRIAAAGRAASTRIAAIDSAGNFTFDKGAVDFSPEQQLIPGDAPNYFPPKKVQPGSLGDADYSPFVAVANQNDLVLNAPIVAFGVPAEQLNFCNGNIPPALVHDKVTAICPTTMEVTLKLAHGFADGKSVVYISTDSNNAIPATMESSTYAPATNDLVSSGVVATLYAFANGETGKNNPNRQGFDSALAGEGSPLNILSGLTESSSGYSPLWDIRIAVWTDAAIGQGLRKLVSSGEELAPLAKSGAVVSPAGGPVKSLGLLVNCPVVGFLE